jgi:hypothetical protein
MPDEFSNLVGVPAVICAPDGEQLRSEADALELIGEAMSAGARLVVIPAERLADDFFHLKTGLAGQIVQKFVTYHLRLAIVGDISQHLARSRAFHDFVYEANHGTQLWFLPTLHELTARLQSADGEG